MNSITKNHPKSLKVQLLHFDPVEHRFSSELYISDDGSDEAKNDSNNDSELVSCFQPSDTWINAYREWNNFGEHNGIPHFETTQALHNFNKVGKQLEAALKEEIASDNDNNNKNGVTVQVEPFVALYSAIEVGSVTAWWHIRDKNYKDLIIPIQHLPVSTDLKMRLQAWRMHIGQSSFRKETREACNEEGHQLEREILAELNCCNSATTSQHRGGQSPRRHPLMNQQFYSSIASDTKGSSTGSLGGAIAIENGC